MVLPQFSRYVFGYFVGFVIFFLAIPYGLWSLAEAFSGAAWSRLPLTGAPRLLIAVILGLPGLFFALWSNLALLRKGKGGPTDLLGVALSPRTKQLVTSGPYTHTRNPMVFGMLCVYVSLAVCLSSWPAMLAVVVFALAVRRYVITAEEKRLLRDFGKDYEEYRRRVPMIVPRPFPKTP